MAPAAFGRLCVETSSLDLVSNGIAQPPSGGCVLKLFISERDIISKVPAAFGRLCVETSPPNPSNPSLRPAAFGRLCVETAMVRTNELFNKTSRLRAAVC